MAYKNTREEIILIEIQLEPIQYGMIDYSESTK